MKRHLPDVVPLLVLLPPLLLGSGCGVPACAQERRGPTTLENLLQENAQVTPQGTVARPHHGSTDPVIAAAWKRYDGAIRAASASLLQRIDQDLRQAKPTTDADASAGLEAAKKAFVEQGTLPSMLDAGLRNARRDAETAYRDAAAALRQQYETTAAKLRKTEDPEEAEAIVQEWTLLQNSLDLAKEPQLDSTWKHSITNGPSAGISLYSNGSINSPDGPDTWSLSGTTLVIRWQNPEAPGGGVGRYLRSVPPRRLLLRHQSTRHANLRHACALGVPVQRRRKSHCDETSAVLAVWSTRQKGPATSGRKPGCPNRLAVARLRPGFDFRPTYSTRK